jgi:hypothetical protein
MEVVKPKAIFYGILLLQDDRLTMVINAPKSEVQEVAVEKKKLKTPA